MEYEGKIIQTNGNDLNKHKHTIMSGHNGIAWGDVRECEKVFYRAFHIPTMNNVVVEPWNNEIVQIDLLTPSELTLNTVRDTGDELVRTTHWRPNDAQRAALLFWLESN